MAYIINNNQLCAIMPNAHPDALGLFCDHFNKYAEPFGITTALRTAGFLSHIAVESMELRATTENLNYSANGLLKTFPKYFNAVTAQQYARKPQKIANRVYANRMGNGNEASGDGWRFRGRGLIQLTGRSNYQAYQDSGFCRGNIILHPELLEKYPGALKSAMWYWMSHGLNAIADRGDITAMTRAVNGWLNGLSERTKYYIRAKEAFNI